MQTTYSENSIAREIISRYGNKENFLKLFNPDKQAEYCKHLERCFSGYAPSLYRTKIAYGDTTAESWLEVQIRDLSEYTGCKDKMTIRQIEETSKIIINNYEYLKITELMYFFQLFKSGRFGRFYGVVDGLVITSSLFEFLKIRKEELNRIERDKINQQRQENEKYIRLFHVSWNEYQEIKWLFNMGYEPERIKSELNDERCSIIQ